MGQLSAKGFFTKVCLGFLFLFIQHQSHSQPLVFTTGDWPPYIFQQGDTVNPQKSGFSVDIVNTIFKRMGLDIRYVTQPYARQIKSVTSGRYMALVGVMVAEAPELVFPTQPIGISLNCFFTKKDNPWRYDKLSSLKQAAIAVIEGYDYAELETHLNQGGDGVLVLTGDEALMMQRMTGLLDAGRITAFVQDTAVAEYYFAQEGKQGAYQVAGCLAPVGLMVGFSPQHPEADQYARRFDEGLRQLRRSGELDVILERYGMKDWKAP